MSPDGPIQLQTSPIIAEVWSVVINFCFGWPIGITPLQILSINLGTEILPGVSMAREPPKAT